MTKEGVARQFFRDFLENLGDYEYIMHALLEGLTLLGRR